MQLGVAADAEAPWEIGVEVCAVKSRNTGFTLMELLVVVSLLAIVAAIVFPVFIEAKTAAREASCKSNLREIGVALQMYRDDWQAYPLSISEPCAWGQNGWAEKLYRYHRTTDLYKCPARDVSFAYAVNSRIGSARAANPLKPSIFITAFEVPGSGTGEVISDGDNSPASGDANMCNCSGARKMQEDGGVYAQMPAAADESGSGETSGSTESDCYDWLCFPGPHNGANNILFSDGHVQRFTDWKFGAMTFDPKSSGYAY